MIQPIPTCHYDKNHKMIYVGHEVKAAGKVWTVVARENSGKSPFFLEREGETRPLNEFGANELELAKALKFGV